MLICILSLLEFLGVFVGNNHPSEDLLVGRLELVSFSVLQDVFLEMLVDDLANRWAFFLSDFEKSFKEILHLLGHGFDLLVLQIALLFALL